MALRVSIVGDGAMGTLCGMILAGKGHPVRLWGRTPAHVQAMAADRENRRYLPGVQLPQGMVCTPDAHVALEAPDLVVCAVPTQFIRATLGAMAALVPPGTPVVSISKGIENATLLRPTQIIAEVLGPRWGGSVAAFSGPSIASEIARQMPATMVVASADAELSRRVQEAFTAAYLRVYVNPDLLGVELAGALKNVVAIAAGILDGMGLGNNCKAALLTRGLVEISRLGVALGAKAETFAGLAGLGDLVTTCFAPEGRNRSFGERVGRGQKPQDVLAQMPGVVEGVPTTRSVLALAAQYDVEMPISESLYAVLFENKDPRRGIADLMSREPKHEQ